jgi:hypothetical protein
MLCKRCKCTKLLTIQLLSRSLIWSTRADTQLIPPYSLLVRPFGVSSKSALLIRKAFSTVWLWTSEPSVSRIQKNRVVCSSTFGNTALNSVFLTRPFSLSSPAQFSSSSPTSSSYRSLISSKSRILFFKIYLSTILTFYRKPQKINNNSSVSQLLKICWISKEISVFSWFWYTSRQSRC